MPTNTDPNKKKRLLVALGIFALPVIAVIFAVIGFTRSHKKPAAKTTDTSVFNTELPTPNLPSKEKSKLEIYMQAEQDSIKRHEAQLKDPLLQAAAQSGEVPSSPTKPLPPPPAGSSRYGVVTSPFADENDRKVTDRLDKLYAALGNNNSDLGRKPGYSPEEPTLPPQSPEVAKLERIMQSFQKNDTATNPQLAQVKQVLDEIKDIQHPQRVPSPSAGFTDNANPLPVASRPIEPVDTDTAAVIVASQNGFFGLDDLSDSSQVAPGTIEAVVHGDQVVETGSIVKLRLLQPIYVGSVQIPANAFIYGPANISGERVSIELTNAICNGRIFPISMKVYDGSDGLDGLYVPGAITRDAVKEGMSQGVSGVSLGTLDPSLGAQAAQAGIETAKSLISRKIRLVKVTLKAGHLAILRSTSPTHS